MKADSKDLWCVKLLFDERNYRACLYILHCHASLLLSISIRSKSLQTNFLTSPYTQIGHNSRQLIVQAKSLFLQLKAKATIHLVTQILDLWTETQKLQSCLEFP